MKTQIHSFTKALSCVIREKQSVVWLRSNTYVPLVNAAIRSLLKDNGYIVFSVAKSSYSAELQAHCATSFLGEAHSYFFGDLSKVSKKDLKSWNQYLSVYDGPHTLFFNAPQSFIRTIPKSWLVVEIPDIVDKKSVQDIIMSLYSKHAKKIIALCDHVWNSTSSIPIELVCLLASYAHVIGNTHKEFITNYIPNLVPNTVSLFTLSQFFLQKDAKHFYQLWNTLSVIYPASFWISFWSDQLWRSSFFIDCMQRGNRNDAYEISKRRLPFSFIKNTWRTIPINALNVSHQLLNDIDFALKNGGDHFWLEFFYIQWFNENDSVG